MYAIRTEVDEIEDESLQIEIHWKIIKLLEKYNVKVHSIRLDPKEIPLYENKQYKLVS